MEMDIDDDQPQQNRHAEYLEKVCRVCGGRISIKTSYSTLKHVSSYGPQLVKYFNTDIQNDLPDLHPTVLCVKCNVKLSKLKKEDEKNKDSAVNTDNNDEVTSPSGSSSVSFRSIFKFNNHSVTNCHVCNLFKRGRPSSSSKAVDVSSSEDFSKIAEKVGFQTASENSFVIFGEKLIEREIAIDRDLKMEVKVFGKALSDERKAKLCIPIFLTQSNAQETFNTVKRLNICAGNDDFTDLIEHKVKFSGIEHFKSNNGEVAAFIETETMQSFDDFKVIRHKQCELAKLVFTEDVKRCQVCSSYRSTCFFISIALSSISRLRYGKKLSIC